jgi:hypothetical protein
MVSFPAYELFPLFGGAWMVADGDLYNFVATLEQL